MGTDERKQRHYRLINVAWEFIKNHLSDNMDDSFWEKCTEDIKEVVNNASPEDKEYVKDLINATLSEFERERRNG